MKRPWLLGALLGCVAASCLNPNPPDYSIKCHPVDNACPDGYQCVAGFCYRASDVPDASTADCSSYCNCISIACSRAPGTFPDEPTCLAKCMMLLPADLQCRLYHCGAAKSDPATHCPHALGQTICN
jgi:hypothetical protein